MDQTELSDCTKRCKSTLHGDIITAAISRRCVTDLDLCSYLNFLCKACESVRDSVGRTALHVAASCGRLLLVRWLVEKRNANINARDDESGLTALHRSIFYGKINVAVELIKLGASTSVLDSDSLTMLEHVMKDGEMPESTEPGEIYVWGSNSNNSLGPHQSRAVPELLDVFHKKYQDEYVSKVYVEKFHSVIVSCSGKVYSCGHGQGGRLGLGTQKTVVVPEAVNFPDNNQNEPITCVNAAISRDHSIYLCSDGNVYSCGLNVHRVLGINPPPAELLTPRQLKQFPEEIKGICAGQYHSVAWSSKTLFTWGLNAGQLGHKNITHDKYITTPKAVNMLNLNQTQIKAVDSSDGAISVYTEKGDIYVLHEYQCRKIASRQLNVTQISTFGGKLNLSLSKDQSNEPVRELKVAVLTNTGNIFLWQESDPQLCRCIYSINRAIIVRQVKINIDSLIFVTNDGEAYQGFIKPRKKKITTPSSEKSAFHKFLEREDCICVKLNKFPRIHRAISITSDTKSHDFCVVQALPYKKFSAPDVIESEFGQNLKSLLNECHENDDLHDVTFKVDSRYFPAHKYIIASKCDYFRKYFMERDEEKVILQNCNSTIFEQFLLYIYTNDCDLLKCGEIANKFKSLCTKHKEASQTVENIAVDPNFSAFEAYKNQIKAKPTEKSKDPVRMLHEMAKKFGCIDLCKILANYEMHKFTIKKKHNDKSALKNLKYAQEPMSDFYDVTINCSDGKQVRAHKCILSARADYFNSLFSSRWHGTATSVISLPYSKAVVEALLEYLYTDTLSYLNNKEQDHLFKLIILADQLFIGRLKEHCEYLLYHCLNLKNAVQFLIFANTYNAVKLKECCLKFIVSNLAPLLELRLLDDLDEILLKEITEFYFEHNPKIWCRVITPYTTAPLEEEILSVSTAYPVSFDDVEKQTSTTSSKSSQKKRSRIHKSNASTEIVGPTSSAVLEKDDNFDFNIQFPDSPNDFGDKVSITASRLRAIKLAEESLENQEIKDDFTPLSSKNNSLAFSSSFEEFPLLNSPPSSNSYHRSSHRSEGRHSKIVRMSQKQRKRLSSENSVEMAESPKNPWKVLEFGSPSSPETSMNAIIISEKKQKENLVKIKSKLLLYTQIEDKAIEDLGKFYNIHQVDDEFISVQRVDLGTVAAPIWVSGVKKLDS